MSMANADTKVYIVDQPILIPQFCWKVETIDLNVVREYIKRMIRVKRGSVVVKIDDISKIEEISRLIGVELERNYVQSDENYFSSQIVFNDANGGDILMLRKVGKI